ncbi:VanZ family protein [Candidatus Nitronereus thalassa]|uniref:VanZ family protein n=2 Tax=Candidatus Nitronereus thalassa TaxID=3020898 RepID=A0ABU3K5B2_9BACT|nr:VanZ family protein [Candidatus Nitronereus thalassa]
MSEKKVKTPKTLQNQGVLILLNLSSVYICILTMMPFTFSFQDEGPFLDLIAKKFGKFFPICCTAAWSLENVISNLVLFIPFGIFLVSLQKFSSYSLSKKILLVGLASGLLSLSVEIMQLFLPRYPSLVDLSMNILSGAIGGIIGHYYFVPVSQFIKSSWVMGCTNRIMIIGVVVYVMLIGLMYTVPLKSNFKNWDQSFLVQLGNEATQDRPWLGKIYQIAVYGKSLGASEVQLNFQAGPYIDKANLRVQDGLLAFYNFTEGSGAMVHDRGEIGLPLNLRIQNPTKIKWLKPNGIELLENTMVKSQEPFRKFFADKGYANSEVTIEAWFQPSDIDQKGPARIISYSKESDSVNFILGQERQNVVFRLRTPLTGETGTKPELYTTDAPLNLNMMHVVATYRPGYETLYLNGQEHKMIRMAKRKYVFQYMEEFCGPYAYSFFLLFPLCFFSCLGFSNCSKNFKPAFFSVGVGMTVLGFSWMVPLETVYMREQGYSTLLFGGLVILASVLISIYFRKTLSGPCSFL